MILHGRKNRFCVKASSLTLRASFSRKPYRRICRSGPEPYRPAGGTTSETGPTSPPVAQRYGHLTMTEQKEKSPRTPCSKTSATNRSKDMREASFVSDRNRANSGFRRSKPPAKDAIRKHEAFFISAGNARKTSPSFRTPRIAYRAGCRYRAKPVRKNVSKKNPRQDGWCRGADQFEPNRISSIAFLNSSRPMAP